jgi:hypothetical protein
MNRKMLCKYTDLDCTYVFFLQINFPCLGLSCVLAAILEDGDSHTRQDPIDTLMSS